MYYNKLFNEVYNIFKEIYENDYGSCLESTVSSKKPIEEKIKVLKERISDIEEYESILEEYKKVFLDSLRIYEEQLKEEIKKKDLEKNSQKYKVNNINKEKPFTKNISIQYVDSTEYDRYTDYTTPSGKVVRVYKNNLQ